MSAEVRSFAVPYRWEGDDKLVNAIYLHREVRVLSHYVEMCGELLFSYIHSGSARTFTIIECIVKLTPRCTIVSIRNAHIAIPMG